MGEAEVPFVPCLTPGCEATPLDIPPAIARALVEYNLRDDPAFQVKFACPHCKKESRYSLEAIARLIPASRRPRPLSVGTSWALLLLELETSDEMRDRAFLGERILVNTERILANEIEEMQLLSRSVLAPSLTVGATVGCGAWGPLKVCVYVRRGTKDADIAVTFPQERSNRLGSFFAAKGDPDADLRGGNLSCSNPSCGAFFLLSYTEFRSKATEAAGSASRLGKGTMPWFALSCESCGTARIVDERSFDELVKY